MKDIRSKMWEAQNEVMLDKKEYPILASAIIADLDVFITDDGDFGGLDLERPEIIKISEFEAKYL